MDYSIYKRTRNEWIKLWSLWISLCIIFGYLFYRSIYGISFFFPFFFFYEKFDRKKRILKRKYQLSEQFVESLQVMISAMKAGNTLEKAVHLSRKRLTEFFGEKAFMIYELQTIERGLQMNRTVESLFADFGKRSDIAEIKEFSEVVSIAKRTGGNLIQIMENTVRFISDKIQMEGEIRVVISGKKMEGRAMGFILPGMLCYMNLSMKHISQVLYHNTAGVLLMTGILFGYLICLVWFDKLSDIRV